MNIQFSPVSKSRKQMTPEDRSTEKASFKAGVCFRAPKPFGHLHIGAPLNGEATVPVLRFRGRRCRRAIARQEITVADAAALIAMMPKES